jgi:hypothetical protein
MNLERERNNWIIIISLSLEFSISLHEVLCILFLSLGPWTAAERDDGCNAMQGRCVVSFPLPPFHYF